MLEQKAQILQRLENPCSTLAVPLSYPLSILIATLTVALLQVVVLRGRELRGREDLYERV